MTQDGVLQFGGIGASPGFGVGHVHLVTHEEHVVPRRTIREHEVDDEIDRFDVAVARSRKQLDSLLKRMRAASSEGILIVEAHRMMLQDVLLVGRAHEAIRDKRLNAEAALERVLKQLDEAFASLEVPQFKERGSEIQFVGKRVMANLIGRYREPSARIPAGAIVVAHELSPPEALELTARRIAGFVTEVGGRTSHVAIMARAMEIPAVVGAHGVVEQVVNGQSIAIDGEGGSVLVNPDRDTLRQYRERQRKHRARTTQLLANRDQPALTLDGVRMRLEGNIEYIEEIESLLAYGGEGIGLYRTEYLFMRTSGLPTEEEQMFEYRRIVEEMAPAPVTFRTLDLGADKKSPGFPLESAGDNPALGLRGIRLALAEETMLRAQLRAILRASTAGSVRLMIPFVTSVDEVRQVKTLFGQVRDELRGEGVAFDEDIPFGCMIEVPSAAMIADVLAREVDFFSIGTNDLTQYTLAVDRGNEDVASFFTALHPAVLRLIFRTAQAGREAGIDVSLCGELAGEALAAPVLLGCGLTTLSMNPISIPLVKDLVRQSYEAACGLLLQDVLECATADEVLVRVKAFHDAHFSTTQVA